VEDGYFEYGGEGEDNIKMNLGHFDVRMRGGWK
jgi:hypothetical protein